MHSMSSTVMNKLTTQALALSLIRDSLINFKLISGLNQLGLRADDYHVYLADTVFKLMGLENQEYSDLLFEKIYLANAGKVKHMNFPASAEELKRLSEHIYEQLIFAKEMLAG